MKEPPPPLGPPYLGRKREAENENLHRHNFPETGGTDNVTPPHLFVGANETQIVLGGGLPAQGTCLLVWWLQRHQTSRLQGVECRV